MRPQTGTCDGLSWRSTFEPLAGRDGCDCRPVGVGYGNGRATDQCKIRGFCQVQLFHVFVSPASLGAGLGSTVVFERTFIIL